MPKITIGHLEFASKKAAKAYFSNLLNSAPLDVLLEDEAHRDVAALFSNHHSQAKTARSAIKFEVERHKMPYIPAFRRFVAIFNDGAIQPFSYAVALDGEMAALNKFRSAARMLVMDELHQWKLRQMDRDGTLRCAIDGKRYNMNDVHVDHKPPLSFAVIVKGFLTARGLDPAAIALEESDDVSTGFADKQLEADFRAYHREMAVLRIVRKQANMAAAAKGRVKPTSKDGTLQRPTPSNHA
jgi:hypothetical protein